MPGNSIDDQVSFDKPPTSREILEGISQRMMHLGVALHLPPDRPLYDQYVCAHCGYVGDPDEVGPERAWVGGRGWTWQIECRDAVACWARWDRQHGLLPPEGDAA